MVDYNNENTLATPSNDINRIQILERRAYVIESIEQYQKYKLSGASGNTMLFRSRLMSLFWEIGGLLKRKWDDYETVKEQLEEGKTEIRTILKIWERINLELDKINLTKIDNRKDYDSTDIEEENRVQNV